MRSAPMAANTVRCTAAEQSQAPSPTGHPFRVVHMEWDAEKKKEALRVYEETRNFLETARRTKIPRTTIQAWVYESASLPEPAPEAGGPTLPDPVPQEYEAVHIDGPATWGILNDLHIPYHDKRTIELFFQECRRRQVNGVLLNGDVMDFYHLSVHYRLPDKPRTRMEIECGKMFFEYARAQLPKARIIYHYGNHDERLKSYLVRKAEEIFDLPALQLESLLELDKYGVESVSEQRIVHLGKLPAVHGHEFRGMGGVMPARWLYLRTGDTAICGHFHRPSHYQFRTIRDHHVGCWSVGCATYLYPQWLRLNQWEHGYAFCEIANGGHFKVDNLRVLKDGSVV